jgi:hypothetical protein
MTQATANKVATLTKNTVRYMTRVKTKDNAPFATSVAKYYPALKKLAAK